MHAKRSVWVFIFVIAIVVTIAMVGNIRAAGDNEGSEDKAVAGAEGSQGLDVIIISNDVYDKDRKGPVTFSHRKHAKDYGISCWDCHHVYEEGINTWSPWEGADKCSDCHDPDEKMDGAMKLQTAYHVNCKNCHKDMAKEKKTTGPYRKCLTCHQKK